MNSLPVHVCHEAPLSLLERSRAKWNTYDYALVHLFAKHPTYYQFFKDSLKMGRMVILDNSIFELKTAFDADSFAKYVDELKPTQYIIPDVLEDYQGTITNCKKWVAKYGSLPGIKIGVVQGKTYQELCDCYTYMSEVADKIAISFDYSYFMMTGRGGNKWGQMASARPRFITSLIEDGIWNFNKPHHLLGAALPQEFAQYSGLWDSCNIESVDTSNPVQQGLLGHRYVDGVGLLTKDETKVADTFNAEYTAEQIGIADYNVEQFRNFCSSDPFTLESLLHDES